MSSSRGPRNFIINLLYNNVPKMLKKLKKRGEKVKTLKHSEIVLKPQNLLKTFRKIF